MAQGSTETQCEFALTNDCNLHERFEIYISYQFNKIHIAINYII